MAPFVIVTNILGFIGVTNYNARTISGLRVSSEEKNGVEIWSFIFYNDCYFIYSDWNKYSNVNTNIREGED